MFASIHGGANSLREELSLLGKVGWEIPVAGIPSGNYR